jgi:hypothetical protein
MSRIVTSIVPLLALTATALGADIPVTPKKLIVVDKLTTADKAKVVFVAKDSAATKGAGEDVEQISVQFDVAYGNGNAAGAFAVPASSVNGWVVNKSTVAKFVNKDAPGGPTEAKVAVIKPGKLLKIVAKGLGDTDIDIFGAGDPGAGGVRTAYCVTNGGEENCHCSEFTGCIYKLITGGTGAKLVCKSGVGDAGCSVTGSSSTTTTTASTSTTTTLPTVCCEYNNASFCLGGWDEIGCLSHGDFTAFANAVCDASGRCVTPPGTPGDCCRAPDSPLVGGCMIAPYDSSACDSVGGTVVTGAVCLTDGTCQVP